MKRTEVNIGKSGLQLIKDEGIVSIGSCFAMEMALRLENSGYSVCNNPFGVVYNPVSVANCVKFLTDGNAFTEEDVIARDTNPVKNDRKKRDDSGCGTISQLPSVHRQIAPDGGGYVSFYHHGSFARTSPGEFLADANAALLKSQTAFRTAKTVIVTFGTAWVYRHMEKGIIVSNCHKHPAWEFRRELLDVQSIYELWNGILGRLPDKQWIFTVSPIRHKKDGMHGNQISKATLLLAVEQLCGAYSNARYFPAYEIVLDELRDYSYFKEDLVHPSDAAIEYVWDRVKQYCMIAD